MSVSIISIKCQLIDQFPIQSWNHIVYKSFGIAEKEAIYLAAHLCQYSLIR